MADTEFIQKMKEKLQSMQDSYQQDMDSKKTEFDKFNTDRAVRDEVGRGEISDEIDRYGLLEVQDRDRLRKIVSALHKIENGGYGLCETCGSHISKERLEAAPESHYCLSCEKRREKE